MRINWAALAIVICINLLADMAIYRYLRRKSQVVLSWIHVALSFLMQIVIAAVMLMPFQDSTVSNGKMQVVMWALWLYFAVYVPKFVGLILASPSVIPLLPKAVRKGFAGLGIATGLFLLGCMIVGVAVTPRQIQVNTVDITPQHLGASFDGYRVVHISDLHLGTYGNDTAFISQMIDSVNALHPDLIAFSGDLVNRQTSEAFPFKQVIARLKAPDGVMAVLGNHDYDDYSRWSSESEKMRDRQMLCDLQREAGWHLMTNENTIIVRGNDSLLVIGPENYGEGHFINYCDMNLAYPDSLRQMPCKILIQHNPVQWREQVTKETDIDLTLSGHTHAMQCVISLFGWRWSPAQLRYKEWGGLYTEGNQNLYVNTGIGMIGVPMRIGVKPEITLITLHANPKQ